MAKRVILFAALFFAWPGLVAQAAADVVIPFCARVINLGGDNAARRDFLGTFGLQIRPYVEGNYNKWDIPFCGIYSVNPQSRYRLSDGTHSRYALTGAQINGRPLQLDATSDVRISIGNSRDGYEVWISTGPRSGPFPMLQFWLRAWPDGHTFPTSDLPDNLNFLSGTENRLSAYFEYIVPEGERTSSFLADNEWSVTLPGEDAGIVEFAGPRVKESNLRLRTAPAIPDVPVTKTAVIVCLPGASSVLVEMTQFLSSRSVKYPLEWSEEARSTSLGNGLYDLDCPASLDRAEAMNAVTITAASEGDDENSDRITVIVLPQSTEDNFNEWHARFNDSLVKNWFTAFLPPVYSRIPLDPEPSDPEPDGDLWDRPCGPDSWPRPECAAWPNNFHPGAVYEMRSAQIASGQGHQAVYDSNGALITDANCPVVGPTGFPCVSAGSVDFVRPVLTDPETLVGHRDLDVLPFIWAAQLDGNPVQGNGLFPTDLTRPLIRVGEHIKQFFDVRPTLPDPPGVVENH